MTTESEEPILAPTVDWVADHVHRYVATDGEDGGTWRRETSILLLITRGRRSGALRRMPLIYGRDGDDYVVVASKGGAPVHPGWFLNLLEDPEVTVQVMDDVFPARARVATPEQRERLWPHMVAIWPDYEEYQRKTSREIPMVILSPSG
jgi:deazaflavin-dependent oxidoreductase (nitroreductase family)